MRIMKNSKKFEEVMAKTMSATAVYSNSKHKKKTLAARKYRNKYAFCELSTHHRSFLSYFSKKTKAINLLFDRI